jgi:hypothetical protein
LDLSRGRQRYLQRRSLYDNGIYPMIDYANGGDIRGMSRARAAGARHMRIASAARLFAALN